MEVEKGIITFSSQIDNEYTVFIVYAESERYSTFREIFGLLDNSVGFLDFNSRLIFIDGECKDLTLDHIIAIQAHEICHYILQHNNIDYSEDRMEIEADIASIEMLNYMGMHIPADLIKERLLGRYGILYSMDSLDFILSQDKKIMFNEYLGKLKKNRINNFFIS